MGRKPTVNLNLPPRFRSKTSSTGRKFFYYDLGGKPRIWKALGSDFVIALKKYAEAEMGNTNHLVVVTFRHVTERYIKQIIPTKAIRTQKDNMVELGNLYKFFDDPPTSIDTIQPQHIRQYLDWREPARTRANREIALFSHIFNKAREWGYTSNTNPCAGVKKFKEIGRTNYVDDQLFQKVWNAADQPMRDAMDMAYLTGQRPEDVLKTDQRDIENDQLSIKQNKTGALVRIRIQGELLTLIEKIKIRKSKLKFTTTSLIVDEKGRRLSYGAMDYRFAKAREIAGVDFSLFQFKDLRSKAATDKEETQGMAAAKDQLGHTNEAMTSHYVRHRLGKLVDPTR